MKKLTIHFVKMSNALVMQVLEQEGLPQQKDTGRVLIRDCVDLGRQVLSLRGRACYLDLMPDASVFTDNTCRDTRLISAIKDISVELFNNGSCDMKEGDIIEVRHQDDEGWYKRRLLAILPKGQKRRYICQWANDEQSDDHMDWEQARPINNYNCKIHDTVTGESLTIDSLDGHDSIMVCWEESSMNDAAPDTFVEPEVCPADGGYCTCGGKDCIGCERNPKES